jgi:glycosyltransferase involved in cell wall biosynthesis
VQGAERAITRPRVGINLCFIRGDWATGLTGYVRQLLDEMLREPAYDWVIYCDSQVAIPAPWAGSAFVHRCRSTDLRPVRIAFEQLALPWLASRDRIDLLFSPAFVSPLWGARWRVATIHDMYYKTFPDSMTPMQRMYRKAFTPLTARRCQRLLAVSQFTASEIGRFLPHASHKVRITPLACAVENATQPGEPIAGLEPGYVLFVANVIANKNAQGLAAAAAHLARAGKTKRFVHVGKDEQGQLAAALAAHGCESSFQRLGRVPSGQLRWLYQNALCAVQPSFSEGFGLPALETQSFGTPLISSNAGSLPEVAGDGALYFSPHDPPRLAQLIEQLENDAGLRRTLIEKGRQNAARFSWKATARATLNAFDELFQGRRDAGSTSSSHAESV